MVGKGLRLGGPCPKTRTISAFALVVVEEAVEFVIELLRPAAHTVELDLPQRPHRGTPGARVLVLVAGIESRIEIISSVFIALLSQGGSTARARCYAAVF
jgi:hypothetical protein